MMLATLALLSALLPAAPPPTALGQWATPMTVQLHVNEVKQLEVGFARGLVCDDLSIVKAELRDHTETNNLLVLTGLKAGNTHCRVGIEKGMPAFYVTILVAR